ncbi:MAG: bifunctional DNA primase/polymerase [Thermoplasmatales archaeon]|nr:bifunctional DNA primase/polymerase [Thermoplasmatales archaeon]
MTNKQDSNGHSEKTIAEKENMKIKETERGRELDLNKWIWFYYEQGFSIIPLKEKDKRPNLNSWKKYIQERPSKEEIQEWIDKKLFKNIGVVCGSVSNNLVVIDIDDKKIIEEIKINLHKVVTSGSWVVETGKGYHFYCKYDMDPGEIRKDTETSIEYRANGGYVVAPPSIHPSNKKYKFLDVEVPGELTDLKNSDVKVLYDDMVQQVKEKRGISTKKADKPSDMENIEADCIKNIFKGGHTQGKRNDTAFALANWYKHVKKLNPTEIKSLMINWNKRNKPPLSDRELNTVVNSALKSDKSTGCKKFKGLSFCPFENNQDCAFLYPHGNKEQRQQRKQRQQKTTQIKGSGGLYDNLVIEPLGNLRYLYNYNGKKGIAIANYDKDTKQHTLGIDNEIFFFKDQALKKVIFEIPSEETIQQYIKGKYHRGF